MKIQRVVLALSVALAAAFSLTGCSSYAQGQITEVEDDMGKDGPVKELEVVRNAIENTMSEPDTYEVHVDADSPCDVGAIYPECDDEDNDDEDNDGEADSSQDDD